MLQVFYFFKKNATVLLQNVTVITKCNDFITKCDSYYKMRRLLQIATVYSSLKLKLFNQYLIVLGYYKKRNS